MYRFLLRPGWLLSHLLVLVLVVTMVNLGLWQLRRHDERAQRNDLVAERALTDPVPLAAALEGDDVRFVRVDTTGTYRADGTVLVANRTLDGAPGFWVMSLLETDDGPAVWVSRGFLNRAAVTAGDESQWAPPTGAVRVTGVLQDSPGGGTFAADDGPPTVNRPDTALLSGADWAAVDDVGAYVQAESDPAPVVVAVPLPALDGGPHLSYAAQWFIFTLIALIGYPLILRRVIRDRARGQTDTLGSHDGVRS